MTPHIGVTQGTLEIIVPNYSTIPRDVIWAINEIALDLLVVSREVSLEVEIDSKTGHAIVLTAHADQAIFASRLTSRKE